MIASRVRNAAFLLPRTGSTILARSSLSKPVLPESRSFRISPVARAQQPRFEDVNPDMLFEQIDTDKNGFIDKTEFTAACQNMHVHELVSIAKSLSRNELSLKKPKEQAKKEGLGQLIIDRMRITLDVTITKIFPAGFGWQYASVVAGNMGFASHSIPFFVCTGIGDGLGVMIGHTGFKILAKATGQKDINVKAEAETGLLLGSASFCSGFSWQPLLNACVRQDMPMTETAFWVCSGCTLAFYTGLRFFRTLYGQVLDMDGVEAPTYANLKADWGLSISIGGATGAFVGTDVTIAGNWLRPVVGIEDGTSDIMGSIIAGSSTSLGFMAFQGGQAVLVPKGKCWLD